MVKRLSKHKRRKILRYIFPKIPHSLLLNYPRDLWHSFEVRAEELGVSLGEFLRREGVIDKVIAEQLATQDPAIAAQGAKKTKKRSPNRIEMIFSNLKR